MDIKLAKFIFVVISLFSVTSCTANGQTNSVLVANIDILLGEELHETSGLVCDASGTFSINDSGNKPKLYELNERGETKAHSLALKNTDWEALAASNSHFYVADIGNNAGKRKYLTIYAVERSKLKLEGKIELQYENNEPSKNVSLSHDFDGEALTYVDNKLVLFSKSWKSRIAKVYFVDLDKKQQKLEVQVSMEGLPGVITGADFDDTTNTYTVVGYEMGGFGFVLPFIAKLSKDFQVIKVDQLYNYGQVEAVCVHNGKTWFTQEKSPFKPAKLVQVSF
ncbi:hypothetical protein J3L16_03240 [Alteromonas sp. 5E99-2]|uniref:hypothetical protein n=1 Tax=Alteromonas sp. 5E99-2 TaxID=2817683 RepID=UPI001A998728|nr:hypothetical protein [Alteromonas sp. 5E99-2]MBO1254699.1 hypothetical protein [Alteromonas sp. 5E99-2]